MTFPSHPALTKFRRIVDKAGPLMLTEKAEALKAACVEPVEPRQQ